MNKQLLSMLSVSLLIVTSCSKTKTEEPTETTCKVKVVEHIYNNGNADVTDRYYYRYDSQGRVTHIDYGKEQSTEYETFTYANNKVTWKGVGGDTEVFNLDANGRVTSANQGSDVLNFKYNTDGQLIEAGIGTDKQTLTYLNGNLSTSAYNSQAWVNITYGNIEASNNVVYGWLFGEVLDFDEIGYRVAPYIGKLSKNLPSKIIYEPGVNQTVVDFTYTNDATGKLSSAKMMSTGGYASEYRFTYECK